MQNCTDCGGKRWYAKISPKTGLQLKDRDGKLLWRCFRCGHVQTEPILEFRPTHLRNDASILYIDVEVSKSVYMNYGAKVPSRHLHPEDRIREYFIICWAASYLHSDTVWSESVTVQDAQSGNDGKILRKIRDLMASADIIAGHNSDAFDIKKLNTRFEKHGIEPVIGKKTLDTLKIARSKLAFESNTLDAICEFYGINQKDEITHDDWRHVILKPNKQLLKKIQVYNEHDVENGKEVLKRLRKLAGKPEHYGTVSHKLPDFIPMKEVKA